MRGVLISILLAVGLCMGAGFGFAQAAPTTEPATRPAGKAVIIEMEGVVDDFTRDNLKRRFEEARELGATTVILEVNTYGGLVSSALEISGFLKRQDDLHVIAFVKEKAISAGAMISCAANEIVMGPSALIGDSAPIQASASGEMQSLGETERAKAESPILADFHHSAIRNGHDPLLLEAMVAVDRVVYYIENSEGEKRFVNAEQYTRLTSDDWRDVPGVRTPVDSEKTLATLDSELAVKIGLASEATSTPEALASSRGLNVVARLTPGIAEQLVNWLGSPLLQFILIIALMVSIKTAIATPGTGGPEATALISLALIVGVPLLTGYGQWWEALAIFIGIALIAVELFVLPGFGVAGILGIILFLGGLVMLFVPPGWPGSMPSFEPIAPAVLRGLIVVLGGLLSSLLLWIWLSRYLPQLPGFNRLLLPDTGIGGAEGVVPSSMVTNEWPTVGAMGRAVTDLRPGGAAAFTDDAINDTRVTDVVSDSGFVRANSPVVVREVHGNRVVVRAV